MKRYIFSLSIAFFLIIFGIGLTIVSFLNITVKDEFNNNNLSENYVSYNYKINSKTTEIKTRMAKDPIIIVDNTMSIGDLKIIIKYYDEIYKIEESRFTVNNTNTININAQHIYDFKIIGKIFDLTIEGLKNNEVYNYVDALLPEIKIYINEADKDFVKVRK